MFSCKKEIKKEPTNTTATSYKIPVYAWAILPENKTDEELKNQFENLKINGVVGLMYAAGHDPLFYQ